MESQFCSAKEEISLYCPAGSTAIDVQQKLSRETGRLSEKLRVRTLEKHLEVFREAWAPWGGSFPLALSGGLLTEGGPLRGAVEALGEKAGGILHPTPVIPVRGAARLALGLAG